jgi:PAS domain S-box-containing protein
LRARPLTLERLLVHVLALVGTIICCLAIRALGMHGLASAGNAAVALTLMIGSIILPALIGWRLAALIKSRWQELFPKAMLSNTSSTFSGLSADFWRRRQTHTSSGSEGSKSSALINLTSIGIKPAALPEGSKSLGEGRAQGICALSREGTVTYVNRKFCALAEIKSAEILGRTLEQINMNPELRAQATQLVEATYQRGPKRLELKLGEPNHNLRFLELESQFAANLESATLPAGPDALILTLRDITDRRTVEATLFAAQRHTTLGRLVAGIAHDFNNALTTIIGHASIARQLARDAALPVQNEHLGSILAAAQGAAEQTRHLMDFSQNAHVPTTVMDLTTYIPEKLGLLKGMSERGCAINYQGPKESLAVIAEQNLVLQAVLCLIDGAVERYKGNGGSIEVSLEREEIEEDLSNLHPSARPGKFARVRIRDEAPGMTPDTLKKALDPLADHSAPMQQSLPIAFAIVRAHDGFLTAESKLEQGTSISLYFPLASTEAREKKQSAAARQTSSFQGKQTCSSILEHAACEVLIVEDDLPVREMISKLTTHLGYSVRSCACAREALEKLHEKPVRLLITDQTLPGLSGRDLAQQFQQESPDTAVLLVSGYSMLSEEHFEDTPNSVPVLSKPFDMDSLAEAIQSALSQRAGVMAKPGAN